VNLLYTLTSYPPAVGGAQLLQHHLGRSLSPRHGIQVVTHWDSDRSDWLIGTTLAAPSRPRDYVVDGIPVHRLGFGWRDKAALIPAVALYYPVMTTALGPISQAIERRLRPYAARADLIHNVRIGREGLSLASLKEARRQKIPFVLTPVHHPRWQGWRYRVFNEIYRSADLLIALTNAERKVLEGLGVERRRIHVTGFGPIVAERDHPAAFRERFGIEGPLVLFLGQHYAYKGFRQLLEAAPRVWRSHPKACFAFVGRAVGGSEEAFRGVGDKRILRLGEVDLQTKTDALAACNLLCVPSTQESFGGVYVEAWTFGKPVIGCRIPAVAEVITDGVDGILVDQDPGSIAGAVTTLLRDSALARAMGASGRRKVADRYTWERLARLTEEAYTDVLGWTHHAPAAPGSANDAIEG
jgi:glycosyltransferase involved in cell wall biosynthesis